MHVVCRHRSIELIKAVQGVADELIVLKSKLEHLNASSRASIQHLPAALFGALNIKCDVGSGCTTAPMVSPSGPLAAQIL